MLVEYLKKNKRGFGLIEIIIGVGIITTLFVTISGFFLQVLRVERRTDSHLRSTYLLFEGIEAVKLLRDNGWAANLAPLTNGTRYYLQFNSGMWETTTAPISIDGSFTRFFELKDAYRDVNDNLAVTGTLDTGTRELTMYVENLEGSRTSTTSMSAYIFNLFNN